MKTFLFVCCLLYAVAAQAQIFNHAKFRGDYFGMAVPVGSCSNERVGIELQVDAEGNIEGRVRNWDDVTILEFSESLSFGSGRFTTSVTGLGDTVRGTFSSTGGTCSGTVKIENGCRYTFKSWRRYKIPQ